jgi:DNA end-binding protein Ku
VQDGNEIKEGEFVYLTEEDFKAAEEEGYRAIEVLDFVPLDEIDPIAFQRTYYLGPAGGAEKVYALLVKAMSASGLAAVARYVFHDRQQLGVLRIRDGVITLESMYFADEIRSTDGILPETRVRVDAKELEMAATLIERFTTSFDHAKYEDEYRDRLLDVVKRKHRGDDIHASPEPERDAPTELLEALRASVEAAKGSANGRTKKPSRKRRAKSKR